MYQSPCRIAIDIFNSNSPANWLVKMDRPLRHRILEAKRLELRMVNLRGLLRIIPRAQIEIARPYPRAPSFVVKPAPRPIESILLAHFGPTEQERVRMILADRLFGPRFASDWVDGRWRIVAPQSKNTLGDLLGLSHELGHILAEESVNSDFAGQLRGETMAMVLEALVVSSVLTAEERSEWVRYNKESDSYNFEFLHREFTDDLDPLLSPAFVFRESIWTSHGYQAVYAGASWIRQNLLTELYAGR